MTADERIEALLNRAGQTISDLPKPTKEQFAYKYEDHVATYDAVNRWNQVEDSLHSPDFMAEYILHLADVIDRMEAALENTLLELEELKNKHNTRDFVSHYRLRRISTPMH